MINFGQAAPGSPLPSCAAQFWTNFPIFGPIFPLFLNKSLKHLKLPKIVLKQTFFFQILVEGGLQTSLGEQSDNCKMTHIIQTLFHNAKIISDQIHIFQTRAYQVQKT